MKDFLLKLAAGVVLAFALVFGAAENADAQTVVQLPAFVAPGAVKDFGNGPIELIVVQGNALFTTSQGFGTVSSINGTLITLNATPTSLPCVNANSSYTSLNCLFGGGGITPGTLVGSFNPSTGSGTGTGPSIGINNLQSTQLQAGMQVGWGSACPATIGTNPGFNAQASVGGGFPFYTNARVCAYSPSNTGPGASVFPLAIGAH